MIRVKVDFHEQLSEKTQINILGFKGIDSSIKFTGYTDIHQLGQYVSLNIDGKITRLYTLVNFLCYENIKLMNFMIPNLAYNLKRKTHN